MFVAPKLTSAEVAADNAACRLAAIAAREFGLEIGFGGRVEEDGAFEITMSVNGADSRIYVPPRLLQRAAQSFFSLVKDYEVPESLVAATLEATLAPWMGRLEKVAGIELSLRRMAVVKSGVAAAAPLTFSLPAFGESMAIAVAPAPGLSLPSLPTTPWTSGDDLILHLPVVMAETAITLGEIDKLDLGDVILLANTASQDISQVRLAISSSEAIIARIDGQKLTVARGGKSMSTNDAATGAKAAPSSKSAATPPPSEPVVSAASLEEVPLKIVFDLGDIELSIADLKALVPGQVINLARDPGNAVRVSVNGRRIGAGEIVEIEGRLGVRIIELAGHNERPAT
jgi:type III secretion protein Q